jgi:hypothetical protein
VPGSTYSIILPHYMGKPSKKVKVPSSEEEEEEELAQEEDLADEEEYD